MEGYALLPCPRCSPSERFLVVRYVKKNLLEHGCQTLSIMRVIVCRCRVQLRSQAEFEALHATKAPAGKRYFHHTRLPEIIGAYPIKASADEGRERERRQAFLDFLLGVLVRSCKSRKCHGMANVTVCKFPMRPVR